MASYDVTMLSQCSPRIPSTHSPFSQGRLLYFYGLGITLASNNDDHEEFKFEATLLSQVIAVDRG